MSRTVKARIKLKADVVVKKLNTSGTKDKFGMLDQGVRKTLKAGSVLSVKLECDDHHKLILIEHRGFGSGWVEIGQDFVIIPQGKLSKALFE